MKKIAYVHERGEYKNMKNKKEKKQEEEELTGMAAVWDYLKTFLIIFCVVFAMNKLVYINAVIPSESMQNTIMKGDRVLGNRLAYIIIIIVKTITILYVKENVKWLNWMVRLH